MYLNSRTEKIIFTISLVSFGVFIGLMLYFVYQNYNSETNQISVAASTNAFSTKIYKNNNYDVFTETKVPTDMLELTTGDVLARNKYLKIIGESKIDIKVRGSRIDVNEGIAYIKLNADFYIKFKDVDVYNLARSGDELLVDSKSKRIIYLNRATETKWMVDVWGTATFNVNELKNTPAYANLMLLLENLEEVPEYLEGYL